MLHYVADLWRALIAAGGGMGDAALVQAHAQIMATLVTLLLTLLLIPVQQASSQYSSALLRYFRSDRTLIAYLAVLLLLLLCVLGFMLMTPKVWIDWAASACVVASFFILVAVIVRITTMLDVTAFLLPELKKKTQQHLDAAFRATPEADTSVGDQWQRALEEGSRVGEFAKYGEPKYVVTSDLRELQQDVLVWKTLGIRLTDAGDYQAFERLVTDLGDITRGYLDERRDYRTADDKFLWFLAETFDHLARSAETQANETFSEVLFRTVAACAESAVATNTRVLGVANGYHKLADPFSQLLKRHAIRARDAGGRTRAYEAIHCYSRIGIGLGKRGYGMSAIEIAEGTLTFGLDGVEKGDTYFFNPASIRVPQILFLIALHSRVYPSHKNPYSSIYALIALTLKHAAAGDIGESLMKPLVYPGADTHVSLICLVALFATDNTPEIAEANLTLVDNVLDAVTQHHIGAGDIETELTRHIHQIGIAALAATRRTVFDALTLTELSDAILKVPHARVMPIFLKCVRQLTTGYASALNAPPFEEIIEKRELERTFIHHEGLNLRMLLSLLYQGLHFDADGGLGIRSALEACIRDLSGSIVGSRELLAGDQHESLEIFAAYLETIGAAELSRALMAALAGKKSPESYADSAVLRALEDPIVRLTQDATNAWNAAIFGPLEAAPASSAV